MKKWVGAIFSVIVIGCLIFLEISLLFDIYSHHKKQENMKKEYNGKIIFTCSTSPDGNRQIGWNLKNDGEYVNLEFYAHYQTQGTGITRIEIQPPDEFIELTKDSSDIIVLPLNSNLRAFCFTITRPIKK